MGLLEGGRTGWQQAGTSEPSLYVTKSQNTVREFSEAALCCVISCPKASFTQGDFELDSARAGPQYHSIIQRQRGSRRAFRKIIMIRHKILLVLFVSFHSISIHCFSSMCNIDHCKR